MNCKHIVAYWGRSPVEVADFDRIQKMYVDQVDAFNESRRAGARGRNIPIPVQFLYANFCPICGHKFEYYHEGVDDQDRPILRVKTCD